MKNTILSNLIAFFLLFSFPISGLQARGLQNSSSVVQVQGFSSLEPVHAGSLLTVAVSVQINPGWHVNAHEGLPDGFIPMTFSLGPGAPASLVETRFPAGEKKALGGLTQAFKVYEKGVTFFADVRLEKKLPMGTVKLPFRLRVQACNDQVCLAPAVVAGSIGLKAAGLGSPVAPINESLFQNGLAVQTVGASENIIAHFFRSKGILITFILIFLGGLALNLTPCVYPMIPLTVAYFGSGKAEKPVATLLKAAAYVLGISVTYSGLGVTAALTGRILGSTLQSPLILCGISILLVTLSLSMFGLYEIQAPAWLLNKVAGGKAQGWMGAFGMGLVFGVVAAPCVDPFSIGLLTFVAAKANPFLGFILFFTLSLGLGFPYLWLGFFSGGLQKLPRSGMWMVWVKKIFGMVLLGMPLYFLNPLLPSAWSKGLVPSYLILAGLLLGWVFSGKGVSAGFENFQRIFGTALAGLGIVIFLIWPKPVALPFEPYDAGLLAQAQKQGLPVLVDFSASWCLPCKELEIKTFSDPRVHAALKHWVLLRADLTQYSSGPVEALRKTYGIKGVPTLVFVGRDGQEKKDLRSIGFLNTQDFLKKIASN
ncbi:MAG: cytochrome c biogenesis protein CcdA [bacterium]